MSIRSLLVCVLVTFAARDAVADDVCAPGHKISTFLTYDEREVLCFPDAQVQVRLPRLAARAQMRMWNGEKKGDDYRIWNSDGLEFVFGALADTTCAAWKADATKHEGATYVAKPAYWLKDSKLGVFEKKEDEGVTALGCFERDGKPTVIKINRKKGAFDGDHLRIVTSVVDQLAHGLAKPVKPKLVKVSESTLKISAMVPEGWDVMFTPHGIMISRHNSTLSVETLTRYPDKTVEAQLRDVVGPVISQSKISDEAGNWKCASRTAILTNPKFHATHWECLREVGDHLVFAHTDSPALELDTMLAVANSVEGIGKLKDDPRDDRKKPLALVKQAFSGTPLTAMVPSGWRYYLNNRERPTVMMEPPFHAGTGSEKLSVQILNSGIGTDAFEYKADIVGADAKPSGAWKCHEEEKMVTCVRPAKTDAKLLVAVKLETFKPETLPYFRKSLTAIGDSIDVAKWLDSAAAARGDEFGLD